jgi:hypothetical protein
VIVGSGSGSASTTAGVIGSSSMIELCFLPFFFLSFLLVGVAKSSCGASNETDRGAETSWMTSSNGVTGSLSITLSRLPALSRFFLSFFDSGGSQEAPARWLCRDVAAPG